MGHYRLPKDEWVKGMWGKKMLTLGKKFHFIFLMYGTVKVIFNKKKLDF